jgi:hypothetical protein
MREYSYSADSFDLRDLRAHGFPRLPSVPFSLLDGKEGVDGSSPSEGSAKAPHRVIARARYGPISDRLAAVEPLAAWPL